MNLKTYGVAFLLALILINPTAPAMEQTSSPQAKKPLSLKFQMARKAYLTYKSGKSTHTTLTDYLAQAPEELKEYVRLFEPLDDELAKLAHGILPAKPDEKRRDAYRRMLRKQLLPLVDTPSDALWHIAVLKDLNSDKYTSEEKTKASIAFFRPIVKKNERLAYTRLLHKAMSNNHELLTAFLSKNGAYLNKQIRIDNTLAEKPIFIALKNGSIALIKTLIDARLARAKRKDAQQYKKSMEKFLNACLSTDSPCLSCSAFSIALATGNRELVALLIAKAKESDLNLFDFMTFRDDQNRTALFYLLQAGSAISWHFKKLMPDPTCPTENSAAGLTYFFNFAVQENLDLNEMLNNVDENQEPFLACNLTDLFPVLLQLAAENRVDLDTFINDQDGATLKKIVREPMYHNTLLILGDFVDTHSIKLQGVEQAVEGAAELGNFKMIDYLIQRGNPVDLNSLLNTRDLNNNTAAMRITSESYRPHEKLRELIDFAKSHNIPLLGLPECLEIAKNRCDLPTIKLFVQMGEDIDVVKYVNSNHTYRGHKPLAAAVSQDSDTAEWLIALAEKQGIELSGIPEALMMARKKADIKIIRLLLPKVEELDVCQFLNKTNSENYTLLTNMVARALPIAQHDNRFQDLKDLVEIAKTYDVKLERVAEALKLAQEYNRSAEIIELLKQLL